MDEVQDDAEVQGDAAAVRLPPPIAYVGAVLAGLLCQWLVAPLSFQLGLPLRIGAATLAVGLGLALIAAAIGLFRRSGQKPEPWKPTPEVVSSGVYRITRNPMYVGMALIQLGIGIGAQNGWILLLIPVALAVVYATAVRHEEAYLERKFGAGYLDYKRSVRRWL